MGASIKTRRWARSRERRTTEYVSIAVGRREAVFDREGILREFRECEPPADARKTLGEFVVVEGVLSSEIEVVVEAFDRPDEDYLCKADAPSLVFYDELTDGEVEVFDIVSLEARALAFAWVDPRTIVVLDAGGHVSFWNWR